MGDVYGAEDLQLRTRVALKTIRPEIAEDQRVLDLFKNEIQMARLVTHPNVCRIYDLAEHDEPATNGTRRLTYFLTMELLTGETLADHLKRNGPLSSELALTIVGQLAAALQAAHDAGVVHGDFKPGNVMLLPNPDGLRVVVMDFGLAVFREQAGLRPESAGGTPAYMAPEQHDGGRVTTATDVFSLGLVIAEMIDACLLKSNSPGGESVPEFLASRELPPAFQHWKPILRRCLDSDPSMRFSRPDAVAKALAEDYAPPPPTRRWGRSRQISVAVGVALTFLGLTTLAIRRYGAYSDERVDPIQLMRIAGEPEAEALPSFSPDGKTIAYLRGAHTLDEIMLLSEGSTVPRTLLRSSIPMRNRPVWTPDGTRLCYRGARIPNFWCVATGGEPSLLLAGEVVSPQFTPDGKSLLFLRQRNGKLALWQSTPPGAEPVPLDYDLMGASSFLISPDGSKWAAASYSGAASGVTVHSPRGGPPHQLIREQGWLFNGLHAWLPDNRHLLLVETSEDFTTSRIVIIDSESSARRLVLIEAANISDATISPDERRIVYASNEGQEGANINEYSIDGNRIRMLAPKALYGVWSPRGDRFVYMTSNNGRKSAFWIQTLDGAAPVQLKPVAANSPGYSPDGRQIAYTVAGKQSGLETISSSGGQPKRVLNAPVTTGEGGPCWSRDSKWLFYVQGQKIWRIPSEGGGQPQEVANSFLRGLVCSGSGNSLQFFLRPRHPVAPGGFPNEIAVVSTDTLSVRTISLKRDLLMLSGDLSRDGGTLYAPQLDKQSVDVLDMRTGAVIRTVHFQLEPTESIVTMSLHPDGKRFLVTTHSQPVDLWLAKGFSVPERGWLRWLRHWAPPER
jgi:serine/threonine protein kinase